MDNTSLLFCLIRARCAVLLGRACIECSLEKVSGRGWSGFGYHPLSHEYSYDRHFSQSCYLDRVLSLQRSLFCLERLSCRWYMRKAHGSSTRANGKGWRQVQHQGSTKDVCSLPVPFCLSGNVCVCMGIHGCAWVWVVFLRYHPLFFLIQALSLAWILLSRLGFLVSKPWGSTCLCLPSTAIESTITQDPPLPTLMWFWGSNSDTYACKANPLLTGLSLQILFFVINCRVAKSLGDGLLPSVELSVTSKGFTRQHPTLCCGPGRAALEFPLLRLVWQAAPPQPHSWRPASPDLSTQGITFFHIWHQETLGVKSTIAWGMTVELNSHIASGQTWQTFCFLPSDSSDSSGEHF